MQTKLLGLCNKWRRTSQSKFSSGSQFRVELPFWYGSQKASDESWRWHGGFVAASLALAFAAKRHGVTYADEQEEAEDA